MRYLNAVPLISVSKKMLFFCKITGLAFFEGDFSTVFV